MEHNEKVRWCKRYEQCIYRIRRLKESIQKLEEAQIQMRLDAQLPAQAIDGMPHSRNARDRMLDYASKMEHVNGKIEKIKRKRKEEIKKCTLVQMEIERAIESLENERYKTILHRKYIMLETWEQIAEEIGKTPEYVRGTMHRKAVERLKIPKSRRAKPPASGSCQ